MFAIAIQCAGGDEPKIARFFGGHKILDHDIGDWIVRNNAGGFFVVSNQVFRSDDVFSAVGLSPLI